jgi:photosystem II stability/assembly factor-like uncharacterized protein
MLPPRISPRETVVAAVAAVSCSLALAACGTMSSPAAPVSATTPGTATTAPKASQPAAPGQPAPPGFQVLSMTFVSDQHGYALGTYSCGTSHCDALLASTDGGATWGQLAAPARIAAGTDGACPGGQPCVQQVRFATPLVGYAFDPSLLMTTDGGATWRQVPATDISSLEAADGVVVRVSSGSAGCSGAPAQVQLAPTGSTTWRPIPAPTFTQICPPVLYRQGERLVLAGYGNPAGGVRATAQIARSSTLGTTWASGPDSCGGSDGYASSVALAPPGVLALLCQHQQVSPTGSYGSAWVRVSGNMGFTFGPDEQVVSGPAAPPGTLLHYQLAASSAGRLLVVEAGRSSSRVLLSQNGGQSWSPVLSLGPGNPVLVGYEDPLTARIALGDQVWTTRDGGQTWTANQF